MVWLATHFLKLRARADRRPDLVLLVFLLLMMNYRFSLKIIALAVVFILRPRINYKPDKIVWFYLLITALGLGNFVFINSDYSQGRLMLTLAGALIWLGCLMSYLQVRDMVQKTPTVLLGEKLRWFTLVNLFFSLIDLVKIMLATGVVNPFTQESPPPYGISSGDLIGGVFGEMHLVNTVVSGLLLLYFLHYRNPLFAFFSLIPFLLTGSNLATLILLAAMLYFIFTRQDKLLKCYTICTLMLFVVFYVKITPTNFSYMNRVISEKIKIIALPVSAPAVTASNVPDQGPVTPNRRAVQEKTKDQLIHEYIAWYRRSHPSLQAPADDHQILVSSIRKNQERSERQTHAVILRVIHHRDSITELKKQSAFFEYGELQKFNLGEKSGKVISFQQSLSYISGSWQYFLFGGGPGSFSSRLAFIASGIVADSRILTLLPFYETKAFSTNHKAIFKYLMYLDDATHSVSNLPFTWYNTLVSEYGLTGMFLFIFFYAGFFIRQWSLMGIGRVIFICMVAFLFFDYWFERLSVMIFFETLVLIVLKLRKNEDPVLQ